MSSAKELDVKQIREMLRDRVADVAQHLFPNGKREKNHWRVGSIDGESGHSFDICLNGDKAGMWGDFAGSEKHSRSLLDLWMRAHNVDFKTALDQVCAWLGVAKPAPKPKRTFPTLNDAIRFVLRGLNEREPGALWHRERLYDYHDKDGNVHFVIVRLDGRPNGKPDKEYRPFHRDEKGAWTIGDPPGLLPLFHLPQLLRPKLNSADPLDEFVFVPEGEKCVCALEEKLGLLATTYAHGALSADLTDWSPLAGWNVVILPDNDLAGRKATVVVLELLLQLSPQAKVRIVELPGLPDKGDCVDWRKARDGKPLEEIKAELLELVKGAEVVRQVELSVIQSDQDDLATRPREFPIDALNPVIRRVAEEIAEIYQIDVAVPAMAALATLAACPGKRVTLIGAASGRVTYPNLYVIGGAPKSYGKNGAGTVTGPLTDASMKLSNDFKKEERPKLRAEHRIKDARAKQLVKEIAKGDENTKARQFELETIEARLAQIADLDARLPSYTVGNATTAALYEILKRNGETIFSYALEAGDPIRIALGKYNKNESADFDLYLSGYTVEILRQSRLSRDDSGDLIPCISVLWFCQPFLLRELYANEEALERGLTARVLPFIIERDTIPKEDDKERFLSDGAQGAWENLVLAALALREHSYQIECSSEARQILRDFHNEAVELRNGEFKDIEGELGRWRENAAKIASGQFMADRLTNGEMQPNEKSILSGEQAGRGVRIARWSHLNSIAMLKKGMLDRRWARVRKLKELASRHGWKVTLRDLERRHAFSAAEVKSLALEYPEMMRVIPIKSGPKGGRPGEMLIFRPKR